MEKIENLKAGRVYRIYQRGNNGEELFLDKENSSFLKKLIARHLFPVANLLAYGFGSNDFCVIVQIKPENELPEKYRLKLYQPISNLFNSYAKAINKKYGRRGRLFQVRFKRRQIYSKQHLLKTIAHLHIRFAGDLPFDVFEESSFVEICNGKSALINSEEILGLYGGVDEFFRVHRELYNLISRAHA